MEGTDRSNILLNLNLFTLSRYLTSRHILCSNYSLNEIHCNYSSNVINVQLKIPLLFNILLEEIIVMALDGLDMVAVIGEEEKKNIPVKL